MSDKEPAPIEDIGKSDVGYTVFSGFCMGTADVVPGVSGGTMAVALGIYHQLLAAITSANANAVKALLKAELRKMLSLVHWRFLGALFLGIACGVGVMVKVVKLPAMVLAKSPQRPLVYAIFFGMVLASAFVLARQMKQWTVMRGAATVVGALAGFTIVNMVPVDTPEHPLFIFGCGAVAICAMLLPGISGSFILLILGKYAYVLGALSKLDLMVILPFIVGCLAGLLSFSRLLKWMLDRWKDTVLAALIGLLIGSLYRIWPYQELTEIIVRDKPRVVGAKPFLPDTVDPLLLGAFVAGCAFVIAIEVYATRRRTRDEAATQE